MPGRNAKDVTAWRQRTKRKLMEYHGNVCVDCGLEGKPWQMQFDHRDPSLKEFGLGDGQSRSYERQLAESMKCDLVCANCHFTRTHIQRCPGCEECSDLVVE